jgi:hypothetical protein
MSGCKIMRGRPTIAERGYALMMLFFFTALLLLSAAAITPNILTEGKREKEEEMIWRGKQYVRGIKLYYRKLGRFPTSIEDLTKPKTGSLRFMRQAYKDPMNKADGSWRLIYVGPAGQLIGSLKAPKKLQVPQAGGLGTPASSIADVKPGNQPGAAPGQSTPSGTPAETGKDSASEGGDSSGGQSGELAEGGAIVGGNIVGVGSKISSPSIKIYDSAKNYRLFEFVWDPAKETLAAQPGAQKGLGLGPGEQPTHSVPTPTPGQEQPPPSAMP